MPVFFHAPSDNAKLPFVSATAVRGLTLFARRGPKDRLRLSAQQHMHPQGFGLYDEFTCEEKTDADPAVGTLGDHAYVAWKSAGSDQVNFARVLLDGEKVLGLADKETFEQPMAGPLALVHHGDRFLLAHTSGGKFAFASVVPFDQSFKDPLTPGVPGCDLLSMTDGDEFYIVGDGGQWEVAGRYHSRPRLTLGPGWYPLLLALKEGELDVYHSGDLTEWQGVIGEQEYFDELTDEDATPDDANVLKRFAVCDPNEVAAAAEALGKITRHDLRKRYDALARLPHAGRLTDADFESAWQCLQELTAFLKSIAAQTLWCAYRVQFPAAPAEPLPEVGEVKVQAPAAGGATARHPDGLGILARAADPFGIAPNSPANEWPNNVLSVKAVRYASGRIARAEDDPKHDYDPAELERCNRVAAEAAARFTRLPVRSDELGELEPFCLPANRGAAAPADLTPEFVRAAFRGTLQPWSQIEIQTAREYGTEALADGQADFYGLSRADVKKHNAIWNETADWFEAHPDLTGHAWYATVDGGGYHGCLAIRLVVGMTKAGSLAGVATVELASGLTRTIEPKDLYPELRKHERKEFQKWFDPATGRVGVPAVLRAFDPDAVKKWINRTESAARKLKQKDRPAFWLDEFAKLKPARTLTLSPVWEAVQRCLANGRFSDYPKPEAPAFYQSFRGFGSVGVGLGFYSYDANDVLKTANWLTAHDADWFRARYDDLRATDYAGFMSAADKRAAADAYEAVREFYRQAKERFAVVVEIRPRPEDPPPAKEKGAKKPAAKKGKAKKGGCESTNAMLAPLLPCMETYGADEGGEWPHNDLSTRIVRFACGNIAREGEEIPHDHDPTEAERCRSLAAEGERLLKPIDPPHDCGGPYLAFFSTANKGELVPEAFTEGFVRDRLFRGTINLECGIRIAPLTAGALAGGDPDEDEDEDEEGDDPPRVKPTEAAAAFVDWLRAQPGLHGWAFVSVGLSEDEGGASHPRLAVALTDRGSVVGVCGYVVWA